MGNLCLFIILIAPTNPTSLYSLSNSTMRSYNKPKVANNALGPFSESRANVVKTNDASNEPRVMGGQHPSLRQRTLSSNTASNVDNNALGPFSGLRALVVDTKGDRTRPHELLSQLEAGTCLMWSYMNTFPDIDYCHMFLGHPEYIGNDFIHPDEYLEFLRFAKEECGEDYETDGLTFKSIRHWLEDFQKELGVVSFKIRRTKMRLHHLLMSMKNERNKSTLYLAKVFLMD